MSGETEQNVSGWTTDTLLALVDRIMIQVDKRLDEIDLRYQQRFEAQQVALRDALAAQAAAVAKAEASTERRFESVNEFRAQLGDQARTFLPRLEYDRAHTDLVERVDQMRITVTEHLAVLDKRVAENAARGKGMAEGWGYVVAGIGVLFGALGAAGKL